MSPNAVPAPEGIDKMGDVTVALEARLEDRLMELEEVTKIVSGAVIPLHRVAGETLDIYIDDIRFGSAEVIVIENMLALRITKICD